MERKQKESSQTSLKNKEFERVCPNCKDNLENLCNMYFNGYPIHNRVICNNCGHEENGMHTINEGDKEKRKG